MPNCQLDTYKCYYFNDSNQLEYITFECHNLPIKEVILMVSDLYNVNVMGIEKSDV